jgi:hypothetical protein
VLPFQPIALSFQPITLSFIFIVLSFDLIAHQFNLLRYHLMALRNHLYPLCYHLSSFLYYPPSLRADPSPLGKTVGNFLREGKLFVHRKVVLCIKEGGEKGFLQLNLSVCLPEKPFGMAGCGILKIKGEL